MFNLHLSPEQLEFRDTVRDFVEEEVKPVTLKALIRVCADLSGKDAEPEDGRVARWRQKLSPWSGRLPDFRKDGFYERFAAKGQVERVAKIHRELAREAGIERSTK